MPNVPFRDLAHWLVEHKLASTFTEHNGTHQIGNPLQWWTSGSHTYDPLNPKQGNTLVHVVATTGNWIPISIGMFVDSVDDVYDILTTILDEREPCEYESAGGKSNAITLLREQIENRSLIIQEVPKDAFIRIDWAHRSI